MAYIKSFKDQNYLIPPNIKDLIPKSHVCFLIDQLADSIDYSEFDERYAGAGHPAYHPRILIKILLMAYVDGVRSSRRIAKNVYENMVYLFLSEKTSPDFRTISDFRKDNQNFVKNVFTSVNAFALEEGMLDLSQLMMDGTMIKANSNDKHVIDRKVLDKLEKYIDREIKKGIDVDEEEDKLYGDRGFHELPEELSDPVKRRKVVKEMVDDINKSMKEKKKDNVKKIRDDIQDLKKFMDENKIKFMSLSDKDSRLMLNKKGRIELSYNAQLVTDKNGLIIANDVVNECDDRNQLVPNIALVERDFGQLAEGTKIVTDGLYDNGKALEQLDHRGLDLYVPPKNVNEEHNEKKKFAKANFTYDENKDFYVCPEGQTLTPRKPHYYKPKEEWRVVYTLSKRVCDACPSKVVCCKNASQRTIIAVPGDAISQRIKEKLRTPEGKAVYKLRKQTVERSFGDIKHNKGFRSFLLRSLEKVKTEWNLISTAHNLVIINNILNRTPHLRLASC